MYPRQETETYKEGRGGGVRKNEKVRSWSSQNGEDAGPVSLDDLSGVVEVEIPR